MAASAAMDRKSLADLLHDPVGLIEGVRSTRQPVRIAVRDGSEVVVVDAESYETALSAAQLRPLLAEAEEDVRAGRTRDMREFLTGFKRDRGIPG